MKISLFCFLMMTMFSLPFTPTTSTSPDDVKPVVITLNSPGEVSAGIFGCWGNGFCSRDVIVQDGSVAAPSTILTNNENGTLVVDFDFSQFNEENTEYYQNRTKYNVTNDFPLTEEETSGLLLEPGTVIKKGIYPIEREGDRLRIVVKIK